MDNEERIFELDVNLIQANPLQPRGLITPESLTELVESIREQGIIEPLVVAKTPAGYQLIAGERRFRSAKILGLSKVPVVIKETTPQGMLEMSIVENVQREDLNPIERGLAYKRLIDEFGLSTNEVAQRLGKSPSTVSNTIRLLSLPDAIKDALISGTITEGHVRPLISLGDPKLMIEIFKKVLRENTSVREIEEVARKAKAQMEQVIPPKATQLISQEFLEKAEEIKSKYQLFEVKIFHSRSRGRMVLDVRGELGPTSEKLQEIIDALLSYTKKETSQES